MGNIQSPCHSGFNIAFETPIEFETPISEASSNQLAYSFLYEHPWGNDTFLKGSPSVTVKLCKNVHSERTPKIDHSKMGTSHLEQLITASKADPK